jgi:hypothetical protein
MITTLLLEQNSCPLSFNPDEVARSLWGPDTSCGKRLFLAKLILPKHKILVLPSRARIIHMWSSGSSVRHVSTQLAPRSSSLGRRSFSSICCERARALNFTSKPLYTLSFRGAWLQGYFYLDLLYNLVQSFGTRPHTFQHVTWRKLSESVRVLTST